MKVLVPLGTRPEIIKLASVVQALGERGFDVRTVATGQHYDRSLTTVFFEGLDLQPAAIWDVCGDEPDRVSRILELAYREVEQERPDLVLLLGDTHTVPLFCLAARRHGVPVAHIEAGLRSLNETSIEEVNRRIAAHDRVAALRAHPPCGPVPGRRGSARGPHPRRRQSRRRCDQGERYRATGALGPQRRGPDRPPRDAMSTTPNGSRTWSS